MIPRGSYLLWSDLLSIGWGKRDWDEQDIFLNGEDLTGLAPTGKWTGCCRPDGDHPNLESTSGFPMAYERSDCWQNQSVRIPASWYTLVYLREIRVDPFYLVGAAPLNGEDTIIERTCGPEMATALSRLKESAEKNLRAWIEDPTVAERTLQEMRVLEPDEAISLLGSMDR